jgi:hypothetical protein
MPNLSIKDVPEPLAEALRQRAARNHRSLQGELMAVITEAIQAGTAGVPQPNPPLQGWQGTRTTEDIAAELFAKYGGGLQRAGRNAVPGGFARRRTSHPGRQDLARAVVAG